MGIIILEALLAMVLLLAIVWWTMFAGRKGGEPPRNEGEEGRKKGPDEPGPR